MPRKPYPTDVSDEEWSFAAPYLSLMDQRAPQREHDLREVFNALRWLVRAGAPWRMLPNDLPPWEAVYQQTRRWLEAGCFEAMVSDLRSIIRVAQGRQGQPSAMVMDGRTLQSSCESGPRAGYDGYKRKRGSKVHMAVDTLGHLPPRQNSCRLDRTPVFGVHEGSRRLCSCGRRSAWWATRSVVHGKRAGARSASSTNAQPCRCLQAPARCRVFHPGGEEREASWHDTDKHSKTERWAGCCHRTAPRPTSWRVRSA